MTVDVRDAAVRRGPLVREIPTSARDDMRVPARVFCDDELWRQIGGDRSLDQLTNVATMPGVTGCVYAMPDAHEGYGFPVGGVAAFDLEDGVISPGGVGYDINCGVRLLAADVAVDAHRDDIETITHDLSRTIPSGAGRGGRYRLSDAELDRVFAEGSGYLVARGLAEPADIDHTEAGGCLADAAPAAVSARARRRGANQLGTIGSGNHFVEVQRVDRIAWPEAAAALGLRIGQLTVLIHTGSRGLGHQVCTDYVQRMDDVMARYDIVLPDRQLACAPFRSPEGEAYFGAMCAAANYAWCNRQTITHLTREVFDRHLGAAGRLRLVCDVAHNIAKVETYDDAPVCVHRKGATRAFGPSHRETPTAYREVGQPVFIPGSMGTASYVLAGADASSELSFGSTCHGAGRRMSRGKARRTKSGAEVRRELTAQGIVVRCGKAQELAEEAPYAYKDVDRVVGVVDGVGMARTVARLVPVGVVKG